MKNVLLWLQRTSDTTYCFSRSLEIRYNEVLLYYYYYICLMAFSRTTWVSRDQKSRTELDMLRDHKPPPIRSIRISDFGLPDPKRDPDRHQNCITWSLTHALPLQKISSKSVHKFASNPTDRRTDRQTDKQTELKT